MLIAEVDDVQDEHFAHEKLSPTLALYRRKNYEAAAETCGELVALGGIGHTSVIYTDQDRYPERVADFGKKMKTGRILVNMPSSQGGIGDLYNFSVAPLPDPWLRLMGWQLDFRECGSKTPDQQEDRCKTRENMLWHKVPKSIYFRRGCLPEAIKDLAGKQRALIVTDRFLFSNGYLDDTVALLKGHNIDVDIFADVEADPTLSDVRKGVEKAKLRSIQM